MKKYILILFFIMHCLLLSAQLVMDTVLPTVYINDTKFSIQNEVYKMQYFDSITRINSEFASVASLISKNSSVNNKENSNGGLSTFSIRGTSASQNAVFWNGFNINAPNIGQFDLNLIPVFLFEDIFIQYGGASSLFGSGVIGGGLHLSNTAKFNKGSNLIFGCEYASFNTYSPAIKYSYSNKRFSTKTSFYLKQSENDYTFINTAEFGNPLDTLHNAAYLSYGIMQDFSYKINKFQQLDLSLWYMYNNRQIPPSIIMRESDSWQLDKNFRSLLSWAITKSKWRLNTKIAFFDDREHYVDSLLSIDNNINTQNISANTSLEYVFTDRLMLFVGSEFSFVSADIESYYYKVNEENLAFLASVKYDLLKKKNLSFILTLRQEFFEWKSIPFTPSFGVNYKINKRLAAKINVSKNFRLPSMNDRYWDPGGNLDLLPETSYNGDVEITGNFGGLQTSLAGFTSMVDDYIQWVPISSTFWTPQNVKNVFSRGLELELLYKKKIKKIAFQISYSCSYTKVTNNNSGDINYGKEITYTPNWRNAAGLYINLPYNISFKYQHNFIGNKYVDTQNTKLLQAYNIADASLIWKFKVKNLESSINLSINNLFNINYNIVEYRAMPLRNFKILLLCRI